MCIFACALWLGCANSECVAARTIGALLPIASCHRLRNQKGPCTPRREIRRALAHRGEGGKDGARDDARDGAWSEGVDIARVAMSVLMFEGSWQQDCAHLGL